MNREDQQTVFSEEQAESRFLKVLFQALSAANIQYAVMRNYTHLPYSAAGSDLDILVSSRDAERVRSVVLDAIQTAGGVPIGIAESIGFFKIYALGQSRDSCGAWWGLRLDINIGLYFRGNKLLDDSCEWPTTLHNEILVLEDSFAGILGVLKEVLNNNELPIRYLAAARMAALENMARIEALLAPMGKPALERFRRLLLEGASDDALEHECQSLRKEIFQHARSIIGFDSWLAQARYEWSKFRRYMHPSGIVIAILGVDGAGKSTVIEAILPVLKAATHNAVVVKHLRPTLLPPLARLKGKKSIFKGPVLEPHGSTPSGWLASIFRLAYLTMDYFLGYWLWTRPRIAKQPTVVIFDRYAYDMALDPRRFRIGLPSHVAMWFTALVPKPDIIYCLHGEPTVIAARKKELSIGETRRQVEEKMRFAAKEPLAILVSTDVSIDLTRNHVLRELMRHLNDKLPIFKQDARRSTHG
jgi:thymidylate kinase